MAEPKKVTARVIIEIVGKPKGHVEKALILVIKKIQSEKGIKIKEEKSYEPKKQENYFSTFSELVIEFDNQDLIVSFCFDYMPASIEIIEPEDLAVSSGELAGILNDILSKLHTVSLNLAGIKTENQMLKKNTEALLKNFLMTILSTPRSIEEMEKIVGIGAKELKPYIEGFVEKGKIKKSKGKYIIVKSLN